MRAVRYAFFGVRAGVLALVLKALVSMYKKCPKSVFAYIVMGLSFAVVTFLNVSAIWAVLAAAILGIAYSVLRARRAKT